MSWSCRSVTSMVQLQCVIDAKRRQGQRLRLRLKRGRCSRRPFRPARRVISPGPATLLRAASHPAFLLAGSPIANATTPVIRADDDFDDGSYERAALVGNRPTYLAPDKRLTTCRKQGGASSYTYRQVWVSCRKVMNISSLEVLDQPSARYRQPLPGPRTLLPGIFLD